MTLYLLAAIVLAQAEPALPTADNLSGEWVTSQKPEDKEPPPGAVKRPDRCYGTEASWVLEQKKGALAAELHPAFFQGGAQPMYITSSFDSARGTAGAGAIHLEGKAGQSTRSMQGALPDYLKKNDRNEPVVYDLKFQPQTHHLVGTRNGKPFWAAPLVRIPLPKTETCPPPP